MRVRKGSFLVDTLLAMMILSIGIIPLFSSITFAYSALTSSVERRIKLDEIYTKTEHDIINFSMNGGDFLSQFDDHDIGPITLHNEYPPLYNSVPYYIAPSLYYKEEPFAVGGRGAGSVLRVHIVKR